MIILTHSHKGSLHTSAAHQSFKIDAICTVSEVLFEVSMLELHSIYQVALVMMLHEMHNTVF